MDIEKILSVILEESHQRPVFEIRLLTGNTATVEIISIWRDGQVTGLQNVNVAIISNRLSHLPRRLIALVKEMEKNMLSKDLPEFGSLFIEKGEPHV